MLAIIEWVSDPQIWLSLWTLFMMEIVMGRDNIIYILLLTGELPAEQ